MTRGRPIASATRCLVDVAALLGLATAPALAGDADPDDRPTLPLLATLNDLRLAHFGPVRGVRWVDGGRRVLSCDWSHVVCWDTASGAELWRHAPADEPTYDGPLLATRREPGAPIVVARGRSIDVLDPSGRLLRGAHDVGWMRAVTLDATGGAVLTWETSPKGDARAWVLVTRRVDDLAETARRPFAVRDAAGQLAEFADTDAFAAAATEPSVALSHSEPCQVVGSLGSGRWLLRDTRKWSIALAARSLPVQPDGPPPWAVRELRPDVTSVQYVRPLDATHALAGRLDGALAILDLDDADRDVALASLESAVTAADVLPGDPARLALGLDDGTIHLVDAHGAERPVPRVHLGFVEAVEASRDGARFATADKGGRVVVWSSETLRPLHTVDRLHAPLALADDGRTLAGCTKEHAFQGVAWEPVERRSVPVWILGGDPMSARFLPGTTRAFIGSWNSYRSQGETQSDARLQLVDVSAGRQLYAINPRGSVGALAVDGGGARVVVSSDNHLRSFDVATGRLLDDRILLAPGHWDGAGRTPFDVDATTGFVALAFDKRKWARAIWRERVGPPYASDDATKEFHALASGLERIRAVRWVREATWCILAGARADPLRRAHGAATGEAADAVEVFDMRRPALAPASYAHPSGVVAAAVILGGRALVTAGEDGMARVWDLTEACPTAPASTEGGGK